MRQIAPSPLLSLRNLRLYSPSLGCGRRLSDLVVNVPHSSIYRFGDGQKAIPTLRDVQWTVKEGESWIITGSQRNDVVEMLLGHTRITPPPPDGLYPFLTASGHDPHDLISHVSFAPQRLASGGAFYDFTARYGAVREEDRITLRESLGAVDEVLAETLDLKRLLDLPVVALSNGQTRRAQILRVLMRSPAPEVLVLTEPLTGLDVDHRPRLLNLLHTLHARRAPRVIMTLRGQDPIPNWATHVVRAENGQEEETRIDELVNAFGFGIGKDGEKEFALLGAGEQALVLLMRALVSKAPLLILDEPFAGMDDAVVTRAKRYLLEGLAPHQAVILVTHWDEEVPWPATVVRQLQLKNGMSV
ncbi:hypothetical protein RSAG8_03314, partial [Rhizoctonia solani AG-8 WAC10335]